MALGAVMADFMFYVGADRREHVVAVRSSTVPINPGYTRDKLGKGEGVEVNKKGLGGVCTYPFLNHSSAAV